MKRLITSAIAASGVLMASTGAFAQALPACSDTAMFPNPIFAAGSSAIEPMLAKIALKVKATNTLIYKPTASCDGPVQVRDDVTLTGNGNYYEVDPNDANKTVTKQCTLDTQKAAVGISDVTYLACYGEELPTNLNESRGMVQSFEIVVPEANTTFTSISAEQAQSIWGCGMKSVLAPFNDENLIQQRNMTSGTQIQIAKNIGVPANAFKGMPNASTGNMVASLAIATDPDKRIGFVAADAYETRRAMLNAVAFRGFKQTSAYLPDSDANTPDKANVRNGRYVIQGPVRLVSRGAAATGDAKKFIDWFTGATLIDSADAKSYVSIVAKVGNVPLCAMKVAMDKEGGFFATPAARASNCDCAFDSVITNTATPAGCTACTDNTPCGAKTCQYGFCQ